MSAIVAAWRVMSVLSRAAAEHHGSRETVQRFSSAHLLRLTHFLKVELHRRFSSVLCTLIHSLFLCLFLTRAVSLVFSLNFSLPALFFFFLLFSVLASQISYLSSAFSQSLLILTQQLFCPYLWVFWLHFLNVCF